MKTVSAIALRAVQLSDSRPTTPETVNALAQSMLQSGLINPIHVKPAVVYDGAIMTEGYRVIAGNHRVSAARALGWTEIEAFIVADDDELVSELIEIDENLCRAELTAAQRSASIKRRKEIWEALHPSDKPSQLGTVSKGGRGNVEFATDTARVSGEGRSSIHRHLARAEALGDDLGDVTGTSLDKGVELDALAKLPESERKELIQKARAGEQVTARGKDEDERNVRVARQAVQALAVCAKHMDEDEMAEALEGLDVTANVARIAMVIAEAVPA